MGRFLLSNKGLNGFWTSYIILRGPKKNNLEPLEEWLLHKAPSVVATQERFKIFQTLLQNNVKDNMTIASVPCGLMDDLLTLDYSNVKNIKLVGIDLDQNSLKLARENALAHNINNVEFSQQDAWQLKNQEEFDIITSNGLNIYEPIDDKVTGLYKKYYKALKPGGILITSFLTYPPALAKDSPWKNVDKQDALKQKAIFSDIIGVAWQAFRTEELTKSQLEIAGFKILEVISDSHGIFPTVIAQKQ